MNVILNNYSLSECLDAAADSQSEACCSLMSLVTRRVRLLFQHSAWLTELLRRSSSRLELTSVTSALSLQQSWTVHRWTENASLLLRLRWIPPRTCYCRVMRHTFTVLFNVWVHLQSPLVMCVTTEHNSNKQAGCRAEAASSASKHHPSMWSVCVRCQ